MSTFEFIFRVGLAIVLIWFILYFLLIAHEYGHVFACNRLGIKPAKLTVGWPVIHRMTKNNLVHETGVIPVIGYLTIPQIKTLPLRDRALLALAGPLISLLLGLALIGVDQIYPVYLIHLAGHSSITLSVINMIPVPPFDGGAVAEYWLSEMGIKISPGMHKKLTGAGVVIAFATAGMVWKFGGL